MFRKSLKADFYRSKKDNLLWISVIVVVGFALFTFGVYLLIDHLVADDEFMPISITTLTAFKSALNLTDNAGFIILIMTVVLLAKDFRQNTIRNKIIVGVKRSGAYFSSLIVTYLYVLAIMTFNAILTALFLPQLLKVELLKVMSFRVFEELCYGSCDFNSMGNYYSFLNLYN